MICTIDHALHHYIDATPNSIHLRYKNGDVWINGEWLDVNLSRKIRKHSIRFNSNTQEGRMQLSLAILMCYLPLDLALILYPMFCSSMNYKETKLPEYQGDVYMPLRLELLNCTNKKQINSF